jgi:hypothetical protein
MVLSGGSKMARYSSSISNRSSGGGSKKQGLPPTVGVDSSVISLARNKRAGYCCLNFPFISTSVSYKGSVGHIRN